MKTFFIFLIIFIFSFLLFESVPIYAKSDCSASPEPVKTILGLPWKETPCKYNGFIWGKSVWEYLTSNVSTEIGSGETQYLIEQGCKEIYDGCNTCTKNEDGKYSCTKRECMAKHEPKCMKY